MTREEFNEILDKILPPTVGGMVRPTDPIPTDLDFCSEFRQLLQADINLANHENAFLRQLFSNDERCREWINQIMDALAKQDFNLATQKIKGLMSAADKAKVDGMQSGAEINQNAISNIKAGGATVSATEKTDTVEVAAGKNIEVTVKGKVITIDTKNIADGAEVNQNAFSTVQVGTTKINAAAKTDALTIAAGKNISIITDVAEKKITLQIDGELGINLLQRNAAYVVGDIAYSPLLPSWARLECVTAGTTANTEISETNIQVGKMFVDGTLTWIVDDATDGRKAGDIILQHWLRPSFVKANGAVVLRADYPRLWVAVEKSGIACTESQWSGGKQGLYSSGDGSTTFRLPDLRNIFLQGADTAGQSITAGLPNITGSTWVYTYENGGPAGAFSTTSRTQNGCPTQFNSNSYNQISFSAAKSNAIYGKSATVQPPAVTMIAQIKY